MKSSVKSPEKTQNIRFVFSTVFHHCCKVNGKCTKVKKIKSSVKSPEKNKKYRIMFTNIKIKTIKNPFSSHGTIFKQILLTIYNHYKMDVELPFHLE